MAWCVGARLHFEGAATSALLCRLSRCVRHLEGLLVLIDFEEVHRTYLIPMYRDGNWTYQPTNAENPKLGRHVSTHQIFSNNGLQVAIYLYNSVTEAGLCSGVSHCLHLTFSRKDKGKYLLSKDEQRITFNFDLGKAKAIYGFVMGLRDDLNVRVVRTGRSPKTLLGRGEVREGERIVTLTADSPKGSVSVELSETAQFVLAAHALAYGRLLFPSLTDCAIQQMFLPAPVVFRACAETETTGTDTEGAPISDFNACAEQTLAQRHLEASPQRDKLKRVVWAIGQKKWPAMRLDALQRIQNEASLPDMQRLVDEANSGSFLGWDAYL